MTWPLSGSETGGDLVLIQTLLLFICKCKLVSMRTTWFTCEKQEGLYQNKVTSSLASTQRPGHQAHNCKMAYTELVSRIAIKSLQETTDRSTDRPSDWNSLYLFRVKNGPATSLIRSPQPPRLPPKDNLFSFLSLFLYFFFFSKICNK